MKSQFYDYTYNLNKKDYESALCLDKASQKLASFSGQRIITDIWGNFLGIAVKKSAPIYLVFSFNGFLDGVTDLEGYLNSHDLIVNILDSKHTLLLTNKIENTVLDNKVDITIIDTDNKLTQDIYYINLILKVDDTTSITLFSESDGFLKIE